MFYIATKISLPMEISQLYYDKSHGQISYNVFYQLLGVALYLNE